MKNNQDIQLSLHQTRKDKFKSRLPEIYHSTFGIFENIRHSNTNF